MRTVVMAALAALALAGCAGMGRMNTYGMELADAKVSVGTRVFSVWVHPTDSTLLVQRNAGAGMGQGALEGLTLGAVNANLPAPIWRAAADALLKQAVCTATDVYTLDNSITWEAHYTCPAGTDFRSFSAERRAAWRAGVATADPLR